MNYHDIYQNGVHMMPEHLTTDARLDRIETGIDSLLRGQADLTVAFGKLHRRVRELESDAKWKRYVYNVAKAALPFVGGLAAARWPALAHIINDIVNAGLAP